jgi:hypothetical protein
LLTVHDHPHIQVLDETVDDFESLCCSSPSLILREPVQPMQDSPDVLLSFPYKIHCTALSEGNTLTKMDPHDSPCLSALVAKASVESNSTMMLNIISSIAGVGGTRVKISARIRR